MPKQKEKQKVTIEQVQPGCILLAQPFWEDEVYNRAVVLMFPKLYMGDNDEEIIYQGVIVNKQSTVTLGQALPQFGGKEPIYFGGTSKSSTIHYIHCIPDIPGSTDLGNGIFLGGDIEVVTEMIQQDQFDFKKIRFCAGHLGWAEENLKKELEEERWWIESITADKLFEQRPGELWSYKLLSAGHSYGLFAHIPDPKINEKPGKDAKIT
jgi:putative transcriptional regulator